jgi:hypothetical protein
MGQEITCIAHLNGQSSSGTVHLDTDVLRFRGAFRLNIPFVAISALDATDGTLTVTCPEGVATFDLGARATKWADAIRNPRSLLDKLEVKPGQQVAVIGIADAEFLNDLHARVPDALHTDTLTPGTQYDRILIAAEDQVDLARIPALVPHLHPAAGLWIVAPKGQRHLTEMDVILAGRSAGLKDVKVARFSTTHTAHKFVIPKERR